MPHYGRHSDIAENFTSANQLEAGDIVMAIGGKNIDKAHSTSSGQKSKVNKG